MVILPITKAVAQVALRADRDGIAQILAWLDSESRVAIIERVRAVREVETLRKTGTKQSLELSEYQKDYWAGYGDALTNVMHYLTGPGE